MRTRMLLIALLLLVSTTARADTLWTYVGNSTEGPISTATNACSCSLSGTVMLDTSSNVLSYSFTDGAVTLTQANSRMTLDPTVGDSGQFGLFAEWWMDITAPGGIFLFSEFEGSSAEATDSGTGGLYVEGNRGTWTDPIGTPEPRTWIMLGLGWLGLALLFCPLMGRAFRFGMTGKP